MIWQLLPKAAVRSVVVIPRVEMYARAGWRSVSSVACVAELRPGHVVPIAETKETIETEARANPRPGFAKRTSRRGHHGGRRWGRRLLRGLRHGRRIKVAESPYNCLHCLDSSIEAAWEEQRSPEMHGFAAVPLARLARAALARCALDA